MGAHYITICGKRDFTLQGPTSQFQTIELARYVDSISWESGVALVTLTARGSWASASRVEIVTQNVSRLEEEPHTLFAGATIATTVISASAGDAAPKLFETALSTPIARNVRVYLKYTQDTSSTTASTFTISVALLGRN
jgi:hypothetical protein